MANYQKEARTGEKEYRMSRGDDRWHRPGCGGWPNDNEPPFRQIFKKIRPKNLCSECRENLIRDIKIARSGTV